MSGAIILEKAASPSTAMDALRAGAGAIVAVAWPTLREWRRRRRSRGELASYPHDERRDLGFAPDLDAEIAKPFWKQ
jgi:uncharacterized protein YjiS (DUF1127 family)